MHQIYTLSFPDGTTTKGNSQCSSTTSRYPSNLGLSLGSIHLILGSLCLILGIVGLVAEFHAHKLGTALWSGLIFEMTGTSGIIASRKWYRRSYLRCFYVASLLSTLTALLLFALTCVGIANHYAHWNSKGSIKIEDYMASVSANLIVLSIVEIIVSVASATVATKAMKWYDVSRLSTICKKQSIVVRQTFVVANASREEGQCVIPDVLQRTPYNLQTLGSIPRQHSTSEIFQSPNELEKVNHPWLLQTPKCYNQFNDDFENANMY